MNTKAKTRTMVATVNADQANRTVSVVVEHEVWQSFSRAVAPRARKAFKRWIYESIMFGEPREIKASLAEWPVRDEDGRWISVFHFEY